MYTGLIKKLIMLLNFINSFLLVHKKRRYGKTRVIDYEKTRERHKYYTRLHEDKLRDVTIINADLNYLRSLKRYPACRKV